MREGGPVYVRLVVNGNVYYPKYGEVPYPPEAVESEPRAKELFEYLGSIEAWKPEELRKKLAEKFEISELHALPTEEERETMGHRIKQVIEPVCIVHLDRDLSLEVWLDRRIREDGRIIWTEAVVMPSFL